MRPLNSTIAHNSAISCDPMWDHEPSGWETPGHRFGYLLQGGWDGDDLLNGATQPLDVVVPVKDLDGVR